jgi:hypothetical protein
VTALNEEDAQALEQTKADIVLQPFVDSADQAAELLVVKEDMATNKVTELSRMTR